MGVAGLMTFINMNPTLLESCRLHSTQVVIDGNNLLHVLYYDYHTNHRFCGNYDQFAKNIEHYFSAFSDCGIKPIIIFDGGYEIDDRKLRTTLRRAQERIHLAGFISHGGSGKILPVLAEVTFKKVLAKLAVPHVTCDFEADDQLAALANHLGCPVISNDSDFFIFNVRHGFIPLDHLLPEVMKTSDGIKYLDTRIYRIETFIKHFKCPDVNFVPLFATLLGNDFVDGKKFENFFSNIKLPRTKSKRFTIPKKQTKMAGLLIWLEDMDSVQDAIQNIICYFKKEERQQFEKVIYRSIESYTNIESKLQCFFQNSTVELCVQDSGVKSYNGIELPNWFLHEFHQGNLAVYLFNVLILHRVIPLCQVENMESECAHQCADDIRRLVYGILLQHEILSSPKAAVISVNPSRNTHVEEYTRELKNLVKHLIEPRYNLPSGKTVPVLETIPELSREEGTCVLFDALEMEFSKIAEVLPDGLHLVLASTVYWIRHACPKVTKEHLMGLLVSVLKLSWIDPITEMLTLGDQTTCSVEMNHLSRKVIEACTLEEIKSAKQRIEKTVCLPQHDVMCADIIHGFAQWHACLLSAVHLNQLLCRPVPEPDPARVYNGSVAYFFYKELSCRKDPELYVSEVLGRRTVLRDIFNDLMQFCLSSVEGDDFQLSTPRSKKGSKRSGTKKAAKGQGKASVSRGEVQNQPERKKVVKHVRTLVHKSCELTNKFSMLAMSDEDSGQSADEV